jgi:tetrahydromethanopterin S-methyltransferase subunit G
VDNLQIGLWWGLVVGLLMDTLLLLVRSTHLTIEETIILLF